MMVEQDSQTDLARVVDDLVHDLQAGEPLEIGVLGEVDAVGRATGVEQLIGERRRIVLNPSCFI